MTRFAYLLAFSALAIALVSVFWTGLPEDPFSQQVLDLIAFIRSPAVAQGIGWLSWFFPVQAVSQSLPAFINCLIAFFTLRGTLFVLSLHA